MSDKDQQPAGEPDEQAQGASQDEAAGQGEGERSGPPDRIYLGHTPSTSATSDEPDEVSDDVEYVELLRVHTAHDLSEARLLKSMLEDAQIPCTIEDDVASDMATLSGSHLDGVGIYAPEAFMARAQRVLTEQGVISPIDPDRLEAFTARLETALEDEMARRALAQDLDAEEGRDLRHAVLRELAEHGAEGFRAALDLAHQSANRPADEEVHVLLDVATLADLGAFGAETVKAQAVGSLGDLAGAEAPHVRRRAAAALGRIKDAGAAATLVDLLDDPDPVVRDEAIESLYFLTDGEDMGFDAEASEKDRAEAVDKWRRWLASNPSA